MHLIFRAVTDDDFEDFYRICYRACGFDDTPKQDVRQEWNLLRQARGMPGVIIEDRFRMPKSRVVGYAQLVFLTPEFAQSCHDPDAAPYINRRLLAAKRNGETHLLSEEQIALTNAGPGLTALTIHYGWDRERLAAEEQNRVRDFLNSTFLEQYRGYRINDILIEVIGETNRRIALNSGFFMRNDYARYYQSTPAPPPEFYPTLLGVSAEEAEVGSLMNAAFVYSPPRFYFSEGQRALLRLALDGLSDVSIAEEEGVTSAAIKKRWDAIFDRVQQHDEDLLPDAAHSDQRGPEKRTQLLRYLHQHREELRPYLPPARKTPDARPT